jgi:hypothetical protein
MSSVFIYAVLIFIGVEFFLRVLVRKARKTFPWIINNSDSRPKFDTEALQKFLNTSHDPILGWMRPPNSSGVEDGKFGKVKFAIDGAGSRVGSNMFNNCFAVVFGDSYAFCRQVENEETWESKLSSLMQGNILNFGVGNYGADQAFLRFKQTPTPADAKVAILCFVPETISRILSYWKHYLEFGNTFAFKPKFIIVDGDLKLIDNYAKEFKDYLELYSHKNLHAVRSIDFFYKNKFRKLQFRGLYSYHFLKNFERNFRLLNSVLRINSNSLLSPIRLHPEAFQQIMIENTAQAHALYSDNNAVSLLSKILKEFKVECDNRALTSIVVVIPQLMDLAVSPLITDSYGDFYRNLSSSVKCLDLTSLFRAQEDIPSLYIEDHYGGHLSAKGNELVANYLHIYLNSIGEV